MSGSAAASPRWRVAPGATLGGAVAIPGDKSISHRAMLFGGIAEGRTEVDGFLDSEDCLATLNAMRAMGVAIERPAPQRVVVHGVGRGGLQARPRRRAAARHRLGPRGA